MIRTRRLATALGAFISALLIPGCALQYQGARGEVHTIGFVWQTSVLGASGEKPGAAKPVRNVSLTLGPSRQDDVRIQRVRSLGFALNFTRWLHGFDVGWTDVLVVVPSAAGKTFVDFDSSDWMSSCIVAAPDDPVTE